MHLGGATGPMHTLARQGGPVGRNPETGQLEPVEPIPTPATRRLSDAIRGLGVGDSVVYSLCSSFGCSTYSVELDDVTNNGDGTVTVTWVRKRSGDGLIGDQTIDVFVGGTRIGGETGAWTSSEFTESATGTGAEGDPVRLRMASTFTDDAGEVTATVPPDPFQPGRVTRVAGSCSVSPTELPIGDVTVTLGVDVRNDNPLPALVDVAWGWANEETGNTVILGEVIGAEVPANATQTISQTFTPNISDGQVGSGGVTPEVSNVRQG